MAWQVQSLWETLLGWRENLLRSLADDYGIRLPQSLARATYTHPWPAPEDRQRLAGYARYRAIYEGDHETAYISSGQYRPPKRPYVVDNLLGEITDLKVQRLFGERPRLRGPKDDEAAQQWIDELRQRCDLYTLGADLAIGTDYRGDGFLKVRYDPEVGAIIENIPASMVRLTIAGNTISAATIEELILDGDHIYLLQETHTAGTISYRLYRLRGNSSSDLGYTPETDEVSLQAIPATAELEPETPTGVDELLLIHVAHGGGDDRTVWGISAYANDLDSLQGELNNRMTQRAEVLDKHADPYMHGPADLIDDTGKLKLNADERYIGITGRDQVPGYIAWDPQLVAVENEIADLRQCIMRDAGISPESLMSDGGGAGAESGRALKLRQARTGTTVKGDQPVYGLGLRTAIARAAALERAQGRPAPELEPEDMTFDWNDGLPDDSMEQVEEIGLEVSYGLLSRETALRQRHPDWDDETIAEELQRIADDRSANRVPAPDERLGLTDDLAPEEPDE